ncbi:hypothetical protein FWF48_00125 [Candidatus Saccharibacteria bacterium]|nr:hypothetical protein [Candidatus Saccharibacteria bacterium]
MTKETKQQPKKSAAGRFAKLVTEGSEEYRKKYEGLTEAEMADKIEQEVNAKMALKTARRDAELEQKMAYKHEKWLSHRKHNVLWRAFWGLFFLVAAAAVLCQILGVFTFVINIWWLILGIFLVAIMVQAAINLNWFFVFVPAAAIATILNYQTSWWNLSGQGVGGIFGVAVLLTIAFSILFHHQSYRDWRRHLNSHHEFHEYSDISESADDSREVAIRANMGEAIKYINSQNLEKVLIDCKLGAVKVYFDNAKIAGDELLVNINCSLGGVEMYVPKTWHVVSGLNAIAGGMSEKNRAQLTQDSPTVRLSGNTNLGGVEIIYI